MVGMKSIGWTWDGGKAGRVHRLRVQVQLMRGEETDISSFGI